MSQIMWCKNYPEMLELIKEKKTQNKANDRSDNP